MNNLSSPLYGFNGRLNKLFPSQVMVDITEVCNLACIHCPHPQFKISPYYKKRFLNPTLNDKMISEVANEGHNITKYIRYTSNGEPLVHPKSYEMILKAVKFSKTQVTLTTNGTLLNEKRIAKIFDTGLNMIDISIDAFNKDTYKKIRVGGDLEIIKKNVLKFIQIKKKLNADTKIVVSFVEQKENSSEINNFKKFWESSGVDKVLVRTLHTNAGSSIKEAINIKTEKRRPCLYPWERIVLNANGFLAFCPTDWYNKSEVANYTKTTIKKTWENNFYQNLRNQHLTNQFKKNNFCKNCPDWCITSWPKDKNKSYADLVEKLLYA